MAIKETYCKNCGGLIDKNTRKCQGCGKQYFHLSKRVFVVAIVGILMIALVGANVYQYIEQTQTVAELNETLSRTIQIKDDLREQRDDYSMKLSSAQMEIGFWNQNFVLVTTTGTKCHHYGCEHLIGAEYKILTIKQAKALGYTPCLDCFANLERMAW